MPTPVQISDSDYPVANGRVLKVERPYYEQHQFNNALYYDNSKKKKTFCSNPLAKFNPLNILLSMFPVLAWLPKYDLKRDLISDIISGFTVGVMHIPQGMGYALLASVPPIIGIYTAFFPVLVYFIFGTSRHASLGTFSVISIMVGKVVLRYTGIYEPMHVVGSLCIVMACFHLIMYSIRFGVLSSLLSDALVSGFTTGAAIGVLTSQVKDLVGIKLTQVLGKFEIVLNWYELLGKLGSTNLVTAGISIFTITIIVLNNELLKPRLSKLCIVPMPIQLIAAVGGTLASGYFDLAKNYNVTVVGHIPTGIPAFQPPDLDLSRNLILDGLIIAIVSYTITVSIAVTFAKSNNYEIDFNQELLALGAANICGTFFSALPLSASLSRSQVQVLTGGRTQVTSVVSCSILFCVLLWIGPFFEILPKCVLASIIVVALKGLLMQVKDFFMFWKISRLDAIIWLATFLAVVIVSIDVGLLVGIVLSIVSIFIRSLKPYTCLLGHVPNTDLYLDVKRYKAAQEIESIKICHYCGSLNFASRSNFKSEVLSLVGIDAAELTRSKPSKPIDINCIIIDFSALSYIDPSGVLALQQLINDFNRLNIRVYIAGASCPVYEMMKRCDLNEKPDGSFNLFPTIHDAVHHAQEKIVSIPSIGDIPPKLNPNVGIDIVPSSDIYRSTTHF